MEEALVNYQGSTTVEGRQLYEAFVLILPPFLTPSCLPHHPIEDPWGRPVGTLGQPLREIFEDPLVTVPRDPSTFSGTAIGDTLMWVLRVQVPSEEVLGSLGNKHASTTWPLWTTLSSAKCFWVHTGFREDLFLRLFPCWGTCCCLFLRRHMEIRTI